MSKASENETVEDIVREIRDRNEVRKVRLRQYGGVHCNCAIAPDDVPAVYADCIESAWRREKCKLAASLTKQRAINKELVDEIVDLRCLLKVAEEARNPCNARDGEGSSLRIGWEGEKEYCVVAKYRQDLQVELEDYDYHRVTGPLPLDTAKHWLDYHKRIRTKSEDPKILVREVSKWRLFDQIEEGGAK